jgi:long-chain fatty acid transport protein
MTKYLCAFHLIFLSCGALADYGNYNSILIGERAAGLGGAYTAFTGDPSGCAYYNPASLARMDGTTLSAAVNAYNKTDAQFGDLDSLESAAMRVNRGSIVPIPASSGTVYSFGNFAAGLSILFPDYDSYTGEIKANSDVTSYMNLKDQSLWVGGSLALNLSEEDAIGLTMYYTSRTFSRSLTDQLSQAGTVFLTNEEKILSQNSLVYILGYYRQLNTNWTFGTSLRLPSLSVNGQGSFYRSSIDTAGGISPAINHKSISAETRIPSRLNIGLGYTQLGKWAFSTDVNLHGRESYTDLDDPFGGDRIRHKETWNIALGGEYFVQPWAALRMGLYTNLSSHPEIDEVNQRQGDRLDMWGFSTNVAFFTTGRSTVTLGGYYSGGKGESTQFVGQEIKEIPKSVQIFSFLVGTSFQL